MGCWNGTCLLTNLPILSGEPIKLIFLLSQPHSGGSVGMGFCYPEDIWRPVGCPIDGLYNDYGYIKEIVKNEAYAAVMGKLRSLYGDVDFEKSIHACNLPLIEKQQLSFCMVPVDIYKGIVATFGNAEDYVRSEDGSGVKKTTVRHRLVEVFDGRKASWNICTNPAVRDLMGYESESDNALPSYWQTVPLEQVVDFEIFRRAMRSLRTAWHPACGLGSQNEDYNLHMVRAKLVEEYCQSQLRKRDGDE